ncbi:hypothetical protein O181_004840 [Austropuccinia psidii MF-1]|uniref:Uncharacterized protein n=1 Tax=Austropuccinia psidii MF-1 TaxID=1389203 RepID=A0A9Q3BH92_9BASI|nr:hypothetical protein [Austropuccinia psidii MF-1]
MAQKGHLGFPWAVIHSLYGLWDPLDPFWPKYNEAKKGQGDLSVGPKPQVGPPDPLKTQEKHVIASNPRGPFPSRLQPWPLAVPEARSHLHKRVPLKIRETPNFNSIGLIMQEPRMVHIWYFISLCTLFPQKSHGDTFRTKLSHSNSSPQIHHPF